MTRFKEFKAFFPYFFTTPKVKGIDNFWKVQGIIGGFNDSNRQIASGVVKTAGESMGDISFRITPKGDLPHYYYTLRDPDPLGTEIKNVAFSRLGTMLHLEIQKEK